MLLALGRQFKPELGFLFLGKLQHAETENSCTNSYVISPSHHDLHQDSIYGVERSTKRESFVTMLKSTMSKELSMTTEGHIAALERRHQELDRMIQAEMQNRQIDDLAVSALKRKKLEVKDQLTRIHTVDQH